MKEHKNIEDLRFLDPQLTIDLIQQRKQYYKNNCSILILKNKKIKQLLRNQKKENIKMRRELKSQIFSRNICSAICVVLFLVTMAQFYLPSPFQDIQYVPKVPTSGKVQKTPMHVLSSVNLYNGGIQGSGTIISKGEKYSLLVSAAHNFKGVVGGKFWVYYPDGTYTEAELLALDKERDLSLSKVDSSTIIENVYVPEVLEKGEITGVGYTNNQGPNLKELQYTTGFYNSNKKYMWNLSVKSGPFWDGDSGGGVFSNEALVGVTSQRDAKIWKTSNCYEKRLYACAHKELLDFLKENPFDEQEYGRWNEKPIYKAVDQSRPPLWKPNSNIPLFIEAKDLELIELSKDFSTEVPETVDLPIVTDLIDDLIENSKMKRPSNIK